MHCRCCACSPYPLDTSVYRRSPRIDSSDFTVLSGLPKAGQIRLHIPYVVERTFATELERIQRSRIEKAIGALSRALDFPSHRSQTSKLAAQLANFESALPQLAAERSAAFLDWLDEIGAVRDQLALDQALKAMEAYFTGASKGTDPNRQPAGPASCRRRSSYRPILVRRGTASDNSTGARTSNPIANLL